MQHAALAVLMFLGLAQTFEVASVKPNIVGNAGGEHGARESISFAPGSLTMRNVTLRTCLRWAYNLQDFRISGPAWIVVQRFDVLAKAARPEPVDQLRLMLQALLASRFNLVLHRETKELPVYELLVAKDGPRLRQSETEGESSMMPGEGDLIYRHYRMAEFADKLAGIPFRVDRTVIDKTNLPGQYDFKLKIAANGTEMKAGFERFEGPAVFDILRQIGLRLQARKDSIEMLVIDHADRNPAEN